MTLPRFVPVLAVLSALACGGDAPAPTIAPEQQANADAFEQRWEVTDLGWNKDVLFAPTGDVIVLSGGKATILARDDGRKLHELKTCRADDAGGRLSDDGRLDVLCGSTAERVHLETGAVETIPTWKPPFAPEIETFDVSGWVKDAEPAGPGLWAASGSFGLALFDPISGAAVRELDGDNAVGVAARDGMACVGTVGGAVRCYATEALPASEWSYSPAAAGEAADEAGGTTSAGHGQHSGTIKAKRGSEVTLSTSGGATPAKGTKATLRKKVKKKIGNFDIEAWLDIASVEVVAVSAGEVRVTVLDEKTEITVNGQKQDQFTVGAATQLEW